MRTLHSTVLVIVLALFCITGSGTQARAEQFTRDAQHNMALLMDRDGWREAARNMMSYLGKYPLENCYKSLLLSKFWADKRPESVSVQNVREVFAMGANLSFLTETIRKVVSEQTGENRRKGQDILDMHLRLQRMSMDPYDATAQICIWLGLTPEQHEKIYTMCVDMIMETTLESIQQE